MKLQWGIKTENRMTYDEAVLYCQFLKEDGYGDWRLPTKDEFVYDWCRFNHVIWHADHLLADQVVITYQVCPVRETKSIIQCIKSVLIDMKLMLPAFIYFYKELMK